MYHVKTAPQKPSFSHTLTPTPALLFQYSALSYNAHQIHLNPQYCREVEGHRGLLVHGPLSLTLMLCVLRSQLDAARHRIRSIDYRNLAPLYVGEPLTVCVRPITPAADDAGEQKWDVWVENKDGGLSVRGTVVVGPA
jgi:hydroxyacyl-ACP dehydratase HTD2-like protein with hotdog domain